jgi:hypothetical protein
VGRRGAGGLTPPLPLCPPRFHATLFPPATNQGAGTKGEPR